MSELEEAIEHMEATYFGHSDDGRLVADAARRQLNLTSPETIREVAVVIHGWPWGPDHPPFYECLCLKFAEAVLRSVEEGTG